jgi:hypothetical protein
MKWFLSLFSETSDISMTRFLSFTCVLTACIIVVYGMYKNVNLDSLIGLCSTFLGFGLGAKVIQKNFEKGSEITSDK